MIINKYKLPRAAYTSLCNTIDNNVSVSISFILVSGKSEI